MSALIFFGGLVVGFFFGWVCMALLTMASRRNELDESMEGRTAGLSPGVKTA